MTVIWSTVLVTGGTGFLGKYVVKELEKRGYRVRVGSSKFDLREKKNCEKMVFGVQKVIHLAARVGGIGSNQAFPGEFFYDNAVMGINLIEAARQKGIEKFVCVGTACSYPKLIPTPFKTDDLWNGYPEETNAPYGIAKKALLVQLQAYRQQYGFNGVYPILTNLYGKGDRSDHVIPDLIKKFKEAKDEVTLWGTGTPTREFLYVKDAARAVVDVMEKYDKSEPLNVGSGEEVSIKDLADIIAKAVGFKGLIKWDKTKPDGQPRRLSDSSRITKEIGWKPEYTFEQGIKELI